MSTVYATPQANKENTGNDRVPAIITPSSIGTSSSGISSLSKQRVIFSGNNLEHFFEPVLPANPTPSSDQEPSKSILKKRSYDEFLADDGLFTSLVPQRSSTPEPENAEGLAAYLLSPVTTLVQSVQNSRAGDVNLPDIIEAYCVLTARIRAKFLPAAVAAASIDAAGEEQPDLPKGFHPAMEPVLEYLDHLVCAMTRDIARAMEDPLKTAPISDKPSVMGESNGPQGLPSPPSSSPSPFDSQATGKRSGMDEQQVKHARDLCTVSQSAMKLLAALFCFTESVQSGELFTETHLSTLLGALLAIPLSSPLPTPNSRKTSALSITLLTAFSTLLSSSESPFASAIAGIVSPNVRAITLSLRRGIDGELGREGKKGAAADSLRATVRFSIAQPDFFAAPFCSTLVPSLLKLLGTSGGVLHAQAGNALASIASAATKVQLDPSHLKINTPDANLNVDVAMLMRACFTIRPAKGKNGEIQLTPILHTITKYFQTLNAVCASRDATNAAESSIEAKAKAAAIQAAAHMSAMWSLTVISAIVVLTDGCLFRSTHQSHKKPGSRTTVLGTGTTGDGPGPAGTAAKIIRMMLDNKRIAIRTAASWAWRAFTWAIMREFERMDEEDEAPGSEQGSEGGKEDDDDSNYTKHQLQRVRLVRRAFDYMDKGVGIGVICALLIGSAGREDRELRLDLSMEAMFVMARRKTSTWDALQVMHRMLATENLPEHEDETGGPSLGWDVNKFLPSALFDGRLAEADSKSLLGLARDEREAARESEWVDEITPVTKAEGLERLSGFYDIWKAAVRGHGIDDKGKVAPLILDTWTDLLARSSKPSSDLLLSFLEETPHEWLNLADPGDLPKQILAHRLVQARFVSALWCAMVRRFGHSNQMRKMAMEIYDRCLSTFQLGPTEGKLQDECFQLFFVLAEVESKIVTLVMEHECLDEDGKREFWTLASITGATGQDEELLRVLSVAPFGELRPFELSDKDWRTWENLWQLYMQQQHDSVSERLVLQSRFAEELVGNLLPQEACHIVSSIVRSLPFPIKASLDLTALFTLINQSLVMAYQSASLDIMALATANLRTLTQNFSQLTAEAFSLLTPGLVMWISDMETLFSEEEYDVIIGSTYDLALRFVHSLPVNEETLVEHCELLACISNRITAKAATIKSFHSFWTETYADVVAFDDVPDELRPLLLLMDESFSSQETQESNAANEETEDPAIDESFELPDPETSSSFELSPPSTPPSDAETLEEESQDPLSLVAPASEAPEDTDVEEDSVQRRTGWTGSYEDLSQQVAVKSRTLQSPVYKGYHQRISFFQPPEDPISGLGLADMSTAVHPSLNVSLAQLAARRIASGTSEDSSTPSSPYSRKRRTWEEDDDGDDVCTPVKRRKQEKVDSDDDSDDDRTPTRPWFDADDIPGLPSTVVPFQPFSKHNLPNGPYQFSASAAPHATKGSVNGTSQHTGKNVPRANSSSQVTNRMFGRGPMPAQAASFFVDSAPLERNNPSAKRRRVTEPPTVQSPVSLQMMPYSDEVEPSSDDVKSDPLPSSDDTITAGGISPSGIFSPAMVPGVPGSDESIESPLKAHLNRKKRLQESKLRSGSSTSSISSASTVGVSGLRNPASVPSQANPVDIQARQAMLTACQLMPSLDEVGLKRMSSFLEQMQAKVHDELRRKSDSEQV